MRSKLAKCGCSFNSEISKDGKVWVPACSRHGETESIEVDLSGRYAICSQCVTKTKSDERLAFFEYKPEFKVDLYYCGCSGWD